MSHCVNKADAESADGMLMRSGNTLTADKSLHETWQALVKAELESSWF